MIVNQNTAIIGTYVVLVPYRREHVLTYHKWMLSTELRELTASEPLTLEEEYDMQRKWQTDADKLTFIILARPRPVSELDQREQSPKTPSQEFAELPMVGDVNLFFKNTSEGDDEVEAEVMIAEDVYRRKGVAFEALQLLFQLMARIGEDNYPSQRLFKKLGFVVTKQVDVFHEIEMRYYGDGKWTGGRIVALIP